jgi:hypothetical protein
MDYPKGAWLKYSMWKCALSKHINNIFQEVELQRDGTVSKMEIVQKEGSREVGRSVDFFN